LPEHLNLPEPSISLEQIGSQIRQILDNGTVADKAALKQLLKNTALL